MTPQTPHFKTGVSYDIPNMILKMIIVLISLGDIMHKSWVRIDKIAHLLSSQISQEQLHDITWWQNGIHAAIQHCFWDCARNKMFHCISFLMTAQQLCIKPPCFLVIFWFCCWWVWFPLYLWKETWKRNWNCQQILLSDNYDKVKRFYTQWNFKFN